MQYSPIGEAWMPLAVVTTTSVSVTSGRLMA